MEHLAGHHERGADGEDSLNRAAIAAANSVLQQVATTQGVWYVDLVAPFLGPDDDEEDTPLLAPDGNHPNAAGHQLIAATILHAVPSVLRSLS